MQTHNTGILPHLAAIMVVCVWGTTFIVTKVLLQHDMMPADIFFCRFLLAYVAIWAMSHKRLFADNWKDELCFVMCGAFGGSLYFLAENTALQYAQTSDVSILVSSCPVFSCLVLALFYKTERLSRRQTIGLLLAFLGMAMVVLNGQLVLHVSLLGYALALGAAFTWAFYVTFAKRVMHKYDSWFMTRKVFFYGLLMMTPYYIYVHPLNVDWSVIMMPEVAMSLLFLGLLASLLCYVAWNWAMLKIGASRATIYLYLAPVFTIITAAIVLDEQITWMAMLGTAVLLCGMVLAEKKKKVSKQ